MLERLAHLEVLLDDMTARIAARGIAAERGPASVAATPATVTANGNSAPERPGRWVGFAVVAAGLAGLVWLADELDLGWALARLF